MLNVPAHCNARLGVPALKRFQHSDCRSFTADTFEYWVGRRDVGDVDSYSA
jgi:hypothetical protein